MKRLMMAVAVAPVLAFADIMGDLPDATHAWAVHDPNRPRPPVVSVNAKGVPSDALVLLDGTEATYRANWWQGKPDVPAPWKVDGEAIVSCGGWLSTKRTFGDCQLHVEWCAPDDENPQRGNSGIYLMGLYEIQIINSHEIAPGRYHSIIRSADEQAACVYGQKPPLVNPIRKPGEWQVYDIVFHQPIHDAEGRLLHAGTLTIFFNGVLVQDNREIEGPTGYMKRTSDRVHPDRRPLSLQDHGGSVHFRNIWIREITSPWKEDLVSGTSVVSLKAVAEQRRKNAQKLLDGLPALPNDWARLVSALEMLSYSTEKPFLDAATKLADAEAEALPRLPAAVRRNHVSRLRWYFDKMRPAGCLPANWKLIGALDAPQEVKVSLFANMIERYAKENKLTLAEATRRFYDLGVRGFDTSYLDKDLPELAKGPLKPINLYGSVNFAAADGGRSQADALLAQAVKYRVPRIMVIPNAFKKPGEQEAEFAVTVKGLRALAQKAKAAGVTAMVEDFGYADNPCSYVKYLKRYLQEIPELSYALDSGNLHCVGRGEDIREMMRFAGDRIAHVHLKDFLKGDKYDHATIGLGEVPNAEIVRTMHARSFDGWYTLENLVGDPLEDASRQIAAIRLWCSTAK